jgi:glutamate-1-semialdehyde aminotransferase/spore coat polysaccharide biosynthesis protein SpsF (cytidylyltransferase family)
MKTVAIVQARLGSVRLPKKVLSDIGGQPSIQLLLTRLGRSKEIDQIVVAVADEPDNSELLALLTDLGIAHFVGSRDNVLERYLGASEKFSADVVVRITGDCPFIDPQVVDQVIQLRSAHDFHYVSNIAPPTFPDGFDVEVMTHETLEMAGALATENFDLEHVTPIIRRSSQFTKGNLENCEDESWLRLTLDEEADLMVLTNVYAGLGSRDDFTLRDVSQLAKSHPELFLENAGLIRNEGEKLGTGQKLWKHAKNVIPGGNMLLSKRSEMFLPDQWPSYFSKSKGCEVWDLDGNHYFDMASMGVGTNTLGYGNEAVDDAVMRAIRNGNMSTLNCPEEVELADRLLELNPWAGMVRLARTGGEANAIAIRIARASTGKDKVAICGYHGWHDWYLSANLSDDANLDGHLLPGLQPNGVPRQLKGTVIPFEYNDLERLKEILSGGDVAAIKMEVFRSVEPQNNFLADVRKLANDNGVVLIFDECTSGFRETFGGLHKKYGVEPDVAIYGKALGNGYAITAIVGRTLVMQAAQTSFISSTFWTERIGPTAAIATLREMEERQSWVEITRVGESLRRGWLEIAKSNNLAISIGGLPALSTFVFSYANHMELKTYLTQEMLKRGFLASNLFYASISHSSEVIESYLWHLGRVFSEISEMLATPNSSSRLNGPVSHSGFKRIN